MIVISPLLTNISLWQIVNVNAEDNHTKGSDLFISFSSFNQLCLPTYDSYEELHKMLKLAISEGSEGFGMLWLSPLTPAEPSLQEDSAIQSRAVSPCTHLWCAVRILTRDSNSEYHLSQ